MYLLQTIINNQYFFPVLWVFLFFASIKWFYGFREYEKYCKTFIPPISPIGYAKYIFLDLFVVGAITVAGFAGQIWYCEHEQKEAIRHGEFKANRQGSTLPFPIL